MPQTSLKTLISSLQCSPRVRGLFATGSTATKLTPTSDIDLVVILDRNSEQLKALYTTIENRFSDIFFFDQAFCTRLRQQRRPSANGFDGMFLTWLSQGRVLHDPDGILASLRPLAMKKQALQVTIAEKTDAWVRINYNLIANNRYAASTSQTYRSALELRLMYSIVELVTAFFTLRGIPWRGEKEALAYLAKHDRAYLKLLMSLPRTPDLTKRMAIYRQLFSKTLHGSYRQWKKEFIVPIALGPQTAALTAKQTKLWKKLSSAKS